MRTCGKCIHYSHGECIVAAPKWAYELYHEMCKIKKADLHPWKVDENERIDGCPAYKEKE